MENVHHGITVLITWHKQSYASHQAQRTHHGRQHTLLTRQDGRKQQEQTLGQMGADSQKLMLHIELQHDGGCKNAQKGKKVENTDDLPF